MTQLHLLLQWAQDAVQVCIESGANLEAKDNGELTPLLWAAINGNEGRLAPCSFSKQSNRLAEGLFLPLQQVYNANVNAHVLTCKKSIVL